jgi:predicted acyltransferase
MEERVLAQDISAAATVPGVPPVAIVSPVAQRLFSLDALRGFDMFWIIAGEHIFHNMATATHAPFWQMLSTQFTHPDWNGFHAYDLIFPLFIFLAGVSTPFSVGRDLEKGETKQKLTLRVIKRGVILILLGIFCNIRALQFIPISEIRFCSVLGRIGIAYMFANIIWLHSSRRAQYIWFCALLLGYWALLSFTSAPGFPAGDLTMQGNFASYIDRSILPGKLYLDIHDPEGLISAIPAISNGLLGIFAGLLLKEAGASPSVKARRLALAGAAFIAVALLWNLVFPINKNLWTSSFAVLTGGLSLVLLSLFYYIIDVRGYKQWAFFFRVIGLNSILIYISSRFIDWDHANNAFFKWMGQAAGPVYAAVAMSVGFMLVKWMLLYFLYKKKVFLRV